MWTILHLRRQQLDYLDDKTIFSEFFQQVGWQNKKIMPPVVKSDVVLKKIASNWQLACIFSVECRKYQQFSVWVGFRHPGYQITVALTNLKEGSDTIGQMWNQMFRVCTSLFPKLTFHLQITSWKKCCCFPSLNTTTDCSNAFKKHIPINRTCLFYNDSTFHITNVCSTLCIEASVTLSLLHVLQMPGAMIKPYITMECILNLIL